MQFMLNLAVNYGDDYVNIKDIAQKEGISVKFLENIVSIIKPSELIIVKRGASGGYKLSKAPAQISLFDIIEILEGEIFPSEPIDKGRLQLSDIGFVTYKVFDDMKQNLTVFLKTRTLQDLVKEFHNKQNNFMFYI